MIGVVNMMITDIPYDNAYTPRRGDIAIVCTNIERPSNGLAWVSAWTSWYDEDEESTMVLNGSVVLVLFQDGKMWTEVIVNGRKLILNTCSLRELT